LIIAPCNGAPLEEIEGDVIVERALSSEGHGDSGSVNNGSGSVHASKEGSSSGADAGFDEGPRSYCFGPSTVTVSRIREMAVLHYFAEGDAHAPREETVLEP
jgi:hypothetical protein